MKYLIFIPFVFVVFSQACIRPAGSAPQLPDSVAFNIEYSLLKQLNSGGSHAKAAYTAAKAWTIILADSVFLPFNAYSEYSAVEPELQENDYWMWKTDFMHNEKLYETSLVGRIKGDTTSWFQYIGRDTSILNYKWMVGKTVSANDSAYWEVSDHPFNALNRGYYLAVKKNEVGLLKRVGYATIYIEVSDVQVESYNLLWTVRTGAGEFIDIYLNSEDLSGRIRSVSGFGDETWHCWDENLKNIDCESSK